MPINALTHAFVESAIVTVLSESTEPLTVAQIKDQLDMRKTGSTLLIYLCLSRLVKNGLVSAHPVGVFDLPFHIRSDSRFRSNNNETA